MRMEASSGYTASSRPRSVPGFTPAVRPAPRSAAGPNPCDAVSWACADAGRPSSARPAPNRTGPRSTARPPAVWPGRGGTPRSRWTRTTGRASVSRDTVDLSRPIPSAVRRTPGCRSQCGFSIGVLSSDDRCGCCWPMGATPSLVRNFEHFQSQARCCTSILNPGTRLVSIKSSIVYANCVFLGKWGGIPASV